MMYMSVEAHKETLAPKVHRIGAGTFWILLALEGLVLAIALAWVLGTLPTRTPAHLSDNLPRVQAAIIDRLSGITNDPVIEVRPGLSVRESNVRGLTLGGTTYYYYVEGQSNYDPFSRGAVPADRVEELLRDTSGPETLVIYTIHE